MRLALSRILLLPDDCLDVAYKNGLVVKAYVLLRDLAFLVDQEGGRKGLDFPAHKALQLSHQDGLIDSRCPHQRLNDLDHGIDCDTHYLDIFALAVSVIDGDQVWELCSTDVASRGEDIQEDHFALQAGQGDGVALKFLDVLEGESCSRLQPLAQGRDPAQEHREQNHRDTGTS